jgi:hypothetical protein
MASTFITPGASRKRSANPGLARTSTSDPNERAAKRFKKGVAMTASPSQLGARTNIRFAMEGF